MMMPVASHCTSANRYVTSINLPKIVFEGIKRHAVPFGKCALSHFTRGRRPSLTVQQARFKVFWHYWRGKCFRFG